MENPRSWTPLTKAVDEALGHYRKVFAHCDGPEPLDVKASIMAARLIETKAVKADQAVLAKVIEEALEGIRKAGMIMLSHQQWISNAIEASKLG